MIGLTEKKSYTKIPEEVPQINSQRDLPCLVKILLLVRSTYEGLQRLILTACIPSCQRVNTESRFGKRSTSAVFAKNAGSAT